MRHENLSRHRSHGRHGRKSTDRKEERQAPEIPDFDLSNPAPELFSKTAKSLAQAFSEDVNGKKNKRDLNKANQLRKFYDELVDQVEQLRNGAAVEVVLPRVKMLQAKAAYAYGRELVGEAFVNFIVRAVDKVDDRDGIEHFKMLFEAVIGFRKGNEHGLNISIREEKS